MEMYFKIHPCFSCTLGQSTMIRFMNKSYMHLPADNTADPIKLLGAMSKLEKHICSVKYCSENG